MDNETQVLSNGEADGTMNDDGMNAAPDSNAPAADAPVADATIEAVGLRQAALAARAREVLAGAAVVVDTAEDEKQFDRSALLQALVKARFGIDVEPVGDEAVADGVTFCVLKNDDGSAQDELFVTGKNSEGTQIFRAAASLEDIGKALAEFQL